jgi:hypothetical protein
MVRSGPIRRTASGFGLDPAKSKLRQIEFINKNVNDANGIVLANPVSQAFGKQRALRPINSLNKSLHPNPPANRARIITRESDEAARFYTTRVIHVGSGLSAFAVIADMNS